MKQIKNILSNLPSLIQESWMCAPVADHRDLEGYATSFTNSKCGFS